MSAPSFVVQVSLYDEVTGDVEKVIIKNEDSGARAYEIERLFERLGTRIAKIIDPAYYSEDSL